MSEAMSQATSQARPEPLSVKWLKQAQRKVNADPAFRKLGSVDANVGLKAGGSAFLVRFSGFTCHDARKIAAKDLRDADFVLEMSRDRWSRYLDGRRAGTAPTLAVLDTTDGIVTAANPRKKLDFLRCHLSLQAFLDAAAAGVVEGGSAGGAGSVEGASPAGAASTGVGSPSGAGSPPAG